MVILKNKVCVFVDDVPALALVDTGATISAISASFKDLLRRKVVFQWDEMSKFCGVSGDPLQPIGLCNADVSLGGHVTTQFAIIVRSTHDVILGMNFLWECGATVNCCIGQVFISGRELSGLLENRVDETTLCVRDDAVVPPSSTARIAVVCRGADCDSFNTTVELVHVNCVKKNVLVPHYVVSVKGGRAGLWTVSCSTEPVVLPGGLKLAFVREHVST